MIPFIVTPVTLLILYYLWTVIYLQIGLSSLKKSSVPAGMTFSVVIAARNEEENIGHCLATVLTQSISSDRFEIIVVDDRSTDKTADIIRQLQHTHANLSLLSITETPSGISPKKHAVSVAIKSAKHEVIVFTDADCTVPTTWLDTIDRNFFPGIDLVQGITGYKYINGMNRFFYGLQAVDFASHGITAAGGIGANFPINSNANNLAFRKSSFLRAGGYSTDTAISGDDDMLLQKIWDFDHENIHFMTDPAGSVETLPTLTIGAVIEQRTRWGSNTAFYKLPQKAFLGGIFLFYCVTVASLLLSPFFPTAAILFPLLLSIKIFGEVILMVPGLTLFSMRHLILYILPASLIQLPLVIFSVINGFFGSFTWKGQEFTKSAEPIKNNATLDKNQSI